MNKSYFLYLSLFFIMAFPSCSSYSKVNYFQNLDRSKEVDQQISNYSPLTIQPGDILGITFGSLDQTASAIFNNGSNGGSMLSGISVPTSAEPGAGGGSANAVVGYLVDQKGEIRLPLKGAIKVSGLTTYDAQVLLESSLLKFLKEPVITVRIANFKISVLGDVGHPGIFSVSSERITLPEALSLAGDLTITAKRDNILLVREIDGVRKFVTIDINSSDIFKSPYYYLKANDVLYVEADRAKYAPVNGFNRTFPVVLSMVSFALSIVEIVLINKR